MTTIEFQQTEPRTTTRWVVDPTRIAVDFTARTFWGLATVHGHFDWAGGSYEVGPAGARIELAVAVGSIDTRNRTRDEHLRSDDFFDAVRHPLMRFMSTSALDAGDGTMRVTGILEAAGKSVPVDLEATIEEVDGELEIDATAPVDPGRFGMNKGPLGMIRTPVTAHVRARLVPELLVSVTP